MKENQNTIKLNNVLDSTSDSSRASTPIKRSHSVRERTRHESTDAEFEGIHIEPRRGSMTVNSPITKGQRAQLPESLKFNCGKHPNSISPSVSKENVNKKDTTCDKNPFGSFTGSNQSSDKSGNGDGRKSGTDESADTSSTVKGSLIIEFFAISISARFGKSDISRSQRPSSPFVGIKYVLE